jgi:hypothetical protein
MQKNRSFSNGNSSYAIQGDTIQSARDSMNMAENIPKDQKLLVFGGRSSNPTSGNKSASITPIQINHLPIGPGSRRSNKKTTTQQKSKTSTKNSNSTMNKISTAGMIALAGLSIADTLVPEPDSWNILVTGYLPLIINNQ